MKITKLYIKTRTGKIQNWKLELIEMGKSNHPEIHTTFGHIDGKKQTTFDVISSGVNEGKSKSNYCLQQAELLFDRAVKKQIEQGYSENSNPPEHETNIDWTQPLPKELCFYKPQSSISDTSLAKLEENKQALYSIKRDGLMTVVRMSDFGLEIYSRRMDQITPKFPQLTLAFSKLPKRTILLGEMIFDKAGRDDFRTCCSICRSDDDLAVEKQKELGWVKYYAFDIAFHNGQNLLTTMPFKERHALLKKLEKQIGSEYFVASELITKNHKDALQETQDRKLEGLVIWDAEGKMDEDEAFTLSGKPYRPNVLWKSKLKLETDVIVRFDPENQIGEYGKGKLKGLFGNGFMYQLLGEEEIFLGKIGGGLSEEQRKFYTDVDLFPRCFCVEFDSATNKGKLRFPVVKSDRTLTGDKDWQECEVDQRILDAMEDGEE